MFVQKLRNIVLLKTTPMKKINSTLISFIIVSFFLFPNNYLAQLDWDQLGQNIGQGNSSDERGYSVSMNSDGTIVAYGAPSDNNVNGSDAGTVRVFQYNGSQWNQLGSAINGETSGDESGRSISLSSDGYTIAIGAENNNGSGSLSGVGHVRVYHFDGSNWNQIGGDIYGIYVNQRSGYSVSLNANGNIVAIGSPFGLNAGLFEEGLVQVFRFSGAGWTQIGADIVGENNGDRFGSAVSLSSDGYRLAIGGPGNDSYQTSSNVKEGHVRVYEFSFGSNPSTGSWNQLGGDIGADNITWYLQNYGKSVSLSSDGYTVAICGDGNVGVFEYQTGPVNVTGGSMSTWNQKGQYVSGAASLNSVSLNDDGNTFVVGAYDFDINGNSPGFNQGVTKVYEYNVCGVNNNLWIQKGNDINGVYSREHSGYSVSINSIGDHVIAGSPATFGTSTSTPNLARVFFYECDLELIALDTCIENNPGEFLGAIDLTVNGGTGNYSFNWTGPNLFSANSEDVSGLIDDGVYTVIVTDLTDSCNCESDTLSITINCPDSCVLNLSAVDTCILDSLTGDISGFIDLSVSGGSGNYNYSWFPNGEITEDISNLDNGLYSVIVNDNIN